MELQNEFIGRQSELAKLHEAYQKASSGNGQMVLVEGSAGIGKSGLVREFLSQIKTETCAVGISECNDKENLNAYAPFKDLLIELNTSSNTQKGSADKFKSFVKEAGSSWIELIPVIGTYAKIGVETYQAYQNSYDNKPAVKIESENDVFRVFENEFRRLAQEKTVVIFIDDLQWADASSLNLVFGLGKAIRGNSFKILFIGSYRANEVKAGRNKITETGELVNLAHPFTDKLNMLRTYTKTENHVAGNSGWFHEWSLKPFSKSEIDELINTRFPTNDFNQEFFHKMHDVTDGHPLFIVEVLSYLLAEGMITTSGEGFNVKKIELGSLPTSIDGVISEKVERLNKELQKVLAYASVSGEEFSFQIMEKILHMETEEQEDVLEDHLEELSNTHGLLAEDGTTSVYDFYFTQSLVHKFVYAQMSNLKRKRLHRKIASILKDIYGESLAESQELLDKYNLHNQIGMGLIDGVSLQMSLGNEVASSTENGSIGIAESEQVNTAVIIDAAATQLQKATESYEQYAMDEALEFVNKALAFLFKVQEDTDQKKQQKFEAYELRSQVLSWQGHYKDAIHWAEEMLKLAKQLSDSEKIANAQLSIARSLTPAGNSPKAIEYLKEAIEVFKGINKSDAVLDAYYELGRALHVSAKYDEAIELYHVILRKIERTDNEFFKANVLRRLGMSHYRKSENDKAIDYYLKALDVFEKENSSFHIGIVYSGLGNAFKEKGEFEKALNYFEKSMEIGKSQNDQIGISMELSHIAMVNVDKGDYNEAVRLCKESLEIDKKLNDKVSEVFSLSSLGSVYQQMGDYPLALTKLNEAVELAHSLDDKSNLASSLLSLGSLLHDLKEDTKAITKAKEALSFFEVVKDQASIASVNNLLGSIQRSKGENESALNYYNQALEFFQSVNDEIGYLVVINNISNIELEKENYTEAIKNYEICVTAYQKMGLKVDQTRSIANMASTYSLKGDYQKSIELFLESIDIAKSINDKVQLSWQYDKLGDAYEKIDDHDNSFIYYQKATVLNMELKDNDSLFFNWCDSGSALFSLKKFDEAVVQYKLAVQLAQESKEIPKERLVNLYADIGSCYQNIEDYSLAIEYYGKAVEISQELNGLQTEELAENFMKLGNSLYMNDDDMEAVKIYRKAYQIRMNLKTDDYSEDLVDESRNRLGDACCFAGLETESAKLLEETLCYREQKVGVDHESYTVVLEFLKKNNLGSYQANGQAAPKQSHSAQPSAKGVSNTASTNLNTTFELAVSQFGNEEFNKALSNFEMALRIIEEYDDNDEKISNMALINYHLGQTHKNSGNYNASIQNFIDSYNLELKTAEIDNERLAKVCSYLGDVYYLNEDYASAIENHKEGLEIYTQVEGKNGEMVGWAHNDLGLDYYWNSAYELSVHHLKKSLKIISKIYGAEHEQVANLFMRLGNSYLQTDKEYSAVGKYEKARAIREKLFGSNSAEVDDSVCQIGKAHFYNEDTNLAEECLYSSLRFRRNHFGIDSPEYQKTDKWIREHLN